MGEAREWFDQLLKRLKLDRIRFDRRYALPAAIGGGLLVPLTLVLTLWAAGAFGGGDSEPEVLCDPCPTTTRTPRATRTATPSASPCCTPTLAATFGPTEAPTEAPTVAPTPPPEPLTYALTPFLSAGSFNRIVDFAIIPGTGDSEAIVVTQKDESILRVSLTGAFAPTVYGDLSRYAGGSGNEEGLLSAAFSPDFANDRRIYVYYTQDGGSGFPTVLSRFQVSGNSMDASPGSETRILEVPDFASNHNGGRILFGPDGFLYLSTGDGGVAGDPFENGQNIDSLLGKVLRLKVTGENTYVIPPDNPFVNAPGADEIYAYGLRNPWRFSFDRGTGDLWVGDVGQNAWEEVDLVVKGGNYGWDCFEGFAEYEPAGCSGGGYQPPRAVYSHDLGCSVTGGYVYRGGALPELAGRYVYADYCSGLIWTLDSGDPNAQPALLLETGQQISSFYELPDGELLVLTFSNTIFKLARG